MQKELTWEGTQIISQSVNPTQKTLRIAVIGDNVEDHQIKEAEQRMEAYSLEGYHLDVIQGSQSDSLLNLVGELQTSKSDYKQTALKQNQQIHDLETALDGYTHYEKLARELRPELQVLYPHIRTLALTRTVEVRTDSDRVTPVVLAIVGLEHHSRLTPEQTEQLTHWLCARTASDTLQVVVAHK